MLTSGDISKLSDRELREKLREYGTQPGPITGTTRKVYEMQLLNLSSKVRSSGSGVKSKLKTDPSHDCIRMDTIDDRSKPVERAKELYSFDELHLKYLIDQIGETKIDVDSVDLRDIGNTKYDGVRTALALFDGHCQKRSRDDKYSKPKKVKVIGLVQNLFIGANYTSSKNRLIHNHMHHKEIFAYHATALTNVPSIIRNNLDPNNPVKHGRRFGDGCYFSEYPEFSFQYGRDCLLVFKVLVVPGHHKRYKSDEKGFCEQIIIKDPSLFRLVYVLYF